MKTIFFHNIMSPYKTLLFNEMANLWRGSFIVCYFARTSVLREWTIEEEKMRYPYIVLEKEKRWEEIPSLCLAWRAFMTCLRERPDCLLLGEYSTLPYWAAWMYGLVTGKYMAAVVESQGQDHARTGLAAKLKAGMKKLFLSKCRMVLVAGEKHKAYVKGYGIPEKRIAVMGGVGGVDSAIYAPYRAQYDTAEKRKALAGELGLPHFRYFLYVGRFSAEKNLLALLSAFADSGAAEKGWGLLLVGSGPQEDALRGRIAERGIRNVCFAGFVQQDRLPLYYLASTVFVLPSLSEPWGLVIDEAIAMGLPVIASERCGCVPDLVRDGENGRMFPPENEEALIDVLREMMESMELAHMGERSLSIHSAYSTEASARRIADAVLCS